jgi:hypothetical protein
MNNNHVKYLIEKYFAAETTLEEEAQLKNYFSIENAENIDKEFNKYSYLFQYFESAQQQHLSDAKTNYIQNNVLTKMPKLYAQKTKKPNALKWLLRIAAVFIVGGASWWYIRPAPQNLVVQTQNLENFQEDTEENPEIAYQKAKAALALLSGKMKKGIKTTDNKLKKVERINLFNN